jgi:sulfonate transport system permease protein
MNVPRYPSAALRLDAGAPSERDDKRTNDTRALVDLPTREAAQARALTLSALRSRGLRIGVPRLTRRGSTRLRTGSRASSVM